MKSLIAIALLLLLASCNNTDTGGQGRSGGGSGPGADEPRSISYSLVNTFPHDTSSFTEGLLIYKGKLYESTGNYGTSHLIEADLVTGKPVKKIPIDKKYFGEGISIIRDTIYQLTYKEHTGFAYTLDFKKIREFPVTLEQGWGMTTDGNELIVSDGTSNIYFYDPATFKLLRTQTVTDGGTLGFNINELEYIDGYIYANKWQDPYILKIDPSSGKVIGKIDITKVWEAVRSKDPEADVPNGIAYDPATKKIYITGKFWPDLYEIQFGE